MSVAITDSVWSSIHDYVRACGGTPPSEKGFVEPCVSEAAIAVSHAINREILRSVRRRFNEALDAAEKLYTP